MDSLTLWNGIYSKSVQAKYQCNSKLRLIYQKNDVKVPMYVKNDVTLPMYGKIKTELS